MPWNYPVWQVFRVAAPILAAGNVVVLRHASNVCGTAVHVRRLFEGLFPAPLLTVVFTDHATTHRVIADGRVAGVTFTGSTAAGRAIATTAARHIKKHVLELGGSDPFVVLPGADPKEAARAALASRFQNAGQSCIAAKRMIVTDPVASEFVEELAVGVRRIALGDPLDPATTMGPLATEGGRRAVGDQVKRAVAAGASVLSGGAPVEGPGFYYLPTILDRVGPGMATFDEEVFGPVASIVRAASTHEAIALANTTTYGLAATVWGPQTEAVQAAERIESGYATINGVVASDPRVPLGGVKESGYGRELSSWGMHEFTNVRTTLVRQASGHVLEIQR
jgi:succinate-semialdehyde dehydrogenase/glutarate-semialdehyde dehydrogenase